MIWRVRNRSSPYLIGTPRIERLSSTGSSSTSTLRRYAVRQPDRHMMRRKPHSRFFRKKYPYQYLMVCIRVSQFCCLLRTSTQPPTAAMRSSVKRRVSSLIAFESTTTSESTETMISDFEAATARLIERRLRSEERRVGKEC